MIAPTLAQNESQTAKPDISSSSKHLLFRSDGHWYAVPAIAVRQITTSPERIAIPNCHGALAGVCHLRSEFIPVVSISGLQGLTSAANDETQKTLLVINGKATWALLIAEAGSIETLDVVRSQAIKAADQLPNDHASENHPGGTIESGTAMHEGEILRVLDPDSLYRETQRLIENNWQASAQPQTVTGRNKINLSQGTNDETK